MQQQLIADVTKNAHKLHVIALEEQRAMLEGCIISITEKMAASKQHAAAGPKEKTPVARKITFEEQQAQILKLLQQGHVNSAFQRVRLFYSSSIV